MLSSAIHANYYIPSAPSQEGKKLLSRMSIKNLLQQTVAASRQLITLSDEAINRILIDTAGELMTRQAEVLAANEKDLSRMDQIGRAHV